MSAGVIEAHGELAADDFLFFGVFFFRESRVCHCVAEDIQSFHRARARDIDIENSPIKRGVSVDVAALVLDGFGDFAAFARSGSLEKHVFEDVGKPGTQPAVLVDATGRAPCLDAGDRGIAVHFNDCGKTIWKVVDRSGRRRERKGFHFFLRSGRIFCCFFCLFFRLRGRRR